MHLISDASGTGRSSEPTKASNPAWKRTAEQRKKQFPKQISSISAGAIPTPRRSRKVHIRTPVRSPSPPARTGHPQKDVTEGVFLGAWRGQSLQALLADAGILHNSRAVPQNAQPRDAAMPARDKSSRRRRLGATGHMRTKAEAQGCLSKPGTHRSPETTRNSEEAWTRLSLAALGAGRACT